MATPIISEQWPRFVLPIVRKEWFQQMEAVLSAVASLFGIESSTASVEYSQGIGAGGLVPEYNSAIAEGPAAAIAYDGFSPLYEKTFTHKEYAKGLAIERKLWDDDRLGNIRRRAQTLGLEYGQTRATHMSSVFGNAFSASYVGADAVALVSASHPNRPNDTGTTRSNAGSTAFSYAAVKATLQAGKRMVSDRGLAMPVYYDTIVLPVELGEQATEIVEAVGKPGTGDNDANALKQLNVIIDPYQSDANNWFMVDSRLSKLHLLWFNRVAPELTLDPSSDFNLVAKYRGYMRYSFGWDDWMFVYGHNVS